MVTFVGDVELEACGSSCWQHGVAHADVMSLAMVAVQLFGVFLRVSQEDPQVRGCNNVLLAVQSSRLEGPCSDVVNVVFIQSWHIKLCMWRLCGSAGQSAGAGCVAVATYGMSLMLTSCAVCCGRAELLAWVQRSNVA